MSESRDDHAAAPASVAPAAAAYTAGDLPLVSATPTPSSPLVRLGGLLGIVGSIIGLVALVAACAGVDRVLPGSWFPERYNHVMALGAVSVVLGALGLIVALFGAFTQRSRIAEDTHVMQAAFAGLISILGGLLEMAAWLRWNLFFH